MSKFLATIRTDVPIELNWDELKIEQSDEDKLREIFTELEFKTLLNKFIKGNKEVQKPTIYSLIYLQKIRPLVQTSQKKAPSRGISEVHHNYKLIENEAEAKNICDYLFTKTYLSLDTETTSADAIDADW